MTGIVARLVAELAGRRGPIRLGELAARVDMDVAALRALLLRLGTPGAGSSCPEGESPCRVGSCGSRRRGECPFPTRPGWVVVAGSEEIAALRSRRPGWRDVPSPR